MIVGNVSKGFHFDMEIFHLYFLCDLLHSKKNKQINGFIFLFGKYWFVFYFLLETNVKY